MTDKVASSLIPAGPASVMVSSRLAARTLAERDDRSDEIVLARDGKGDVVTLRDAMTLARGRYAGDPVRIRVRADAYVGGCIVDTPVVIVGDEEVEGESIRRPVIGLDPDDPLLITADGVVMERLVITDLTADAQLERRTPPWEREGYRSEDDDDDDDSDEDDEVWEAPSFEETISRILIVDNADATFRHVSLRNTGSCALTIRGPAAFVEIDDLALDYYGVGWEFSVEDGAEVTVASSGLNDVAIRDALTSVTFRESDLAYVQVFNAANGEFEDCDISDRPRGGVQVDGPGTRVRFTRCRIGREYNDRQAAIVVSGGAVAELDDCEVGGAYLHWPRPALEVRGEGSTATLRSSTISRPEEWHPGSEWLRSIPVVRLDGSEPTPEPERFAIEVTNGGRLEALDTNSIVGGVLVAGQGAALRADSMNAIGNSSPTVVGGAQWALGRVPGHIGGPQRRDSVA